MKNFAIPVLVIAGLVSTQIYAKKPGNNENNKPMDDQLAEITSEGCSYDGQEVEGLLTFAVTPLVPFDLDEDVDFVGMWSWTVDADGELDDDSSDNISHTKFGGGLDMDMNVTYDVSVIDAVDDGFTPLVPTPGPVGEMLPDDLMLDVSMHEDDEDVVFGYTCSEPAVGGVDPDWVWQSTCTATLTDYRAFMEGQVDWDGMKQGYIDAANDGLDPLVSNLYDDVVFTVTSVTVNGIEFDVKAMKPSKGSKPNKNQNYTMNMVCEDEDLPEI